MNKLFVLAAILAMTLTVGTPAFADSYHDIPDFDTATPLPHPFTNFEITDDGFLIEEGDIVQSCEELPYREGALHEALVKACTEVGFPPEGNLPQTGGTPLLLVPIALIVGSGLLLRITAPR